MKSTVTIELPEGVDPFGHHTTRSKRTVFREFMSLFRKLLGQGSYSRSSSRPVAIAGTEQASAVVTCATVINANTVTINTQAFTATQHNSRGTLTLVSAIATDVAEVNGVEFVGQASAATLGTATFDTRTSDTAAAASLVAQINAHPTLAGVVTATNAAGVVTVRAVSSGTGGDAITISSPDATITASGATLSGGATAAVHQFDFGGAAALNNTQTAAALAAAINAATGAMVDDVVEATSSGAAVTIKCRHKGKVGNAITIATSGSTLAITGSVSRLAGGTQSSFTF